MRVQEEVPWGGQSGDGPSAHRWAASGARKAPGYELCLPSLVLRSTAPRCCCRDVWRAALELLGALLWVGFCCPRCPARVCVLGTEQAVWGWTAVWGHEHMVWFAEAAALCLQDEG